MGDLPRGRSRGAIFSGIARLDRAIRRSSVAKGRRDKSTPRRPVSFNPFRPGQSRASETSVNRLDVIRDTRFRMAGRVNR